MIAIGNERSGPAVSAALEAAVRAPSPHNTQPWRFQVGRGRIELLLDRDRVLDVCDPDAREATLACGAALFNLRLALASARQPHSVELAHDPQRPDLLATVRLGWDRGPSAEESRLSAADVSRLAAVIGRRYTNRRPFLDRPVPLHVRTGLSHAARAEGARLEFLEFPGQLDAVAALVRHADGLQTWDPEFRAELERWTAESPRRDGVPRTAGGPRAEEGGLLALRDYGNHSAARRPFEQQPLVAVLTTSGDSRIAQLRAGQAMQRVLLTATAGGLSASFVSQPVEVDETREALREELGGQVFPQTMLRLGYGFAGTPTPRRPAAEVTRELTHDQEAPDVH